MPDIAGILQGTRNEIVYDLPWADYCSAVAMNPSTLIAGLKPKGSLKHLKWYWDASGIADEDEKAPSGPLVWGRAAHALLFEPDKFPERYHCWGERRAGKEYDFFAKAARECGAEVLNLKQFTSVVEAGKAFAKSTEVRPLINSGKAEVSLFTVEEIEDEDGEIHEVQCKGRLDWINGAPNLIVDLKTTRNLNARGFSRDFYSLGYDFKLGMYQRALEKLTGIKYPVTVILLEKTPPYDLAIMPIPNEVLERGAKKALNVLRAVVQAIKANSWPGKGSEEMVLDTPTWEMDEEVDYSDVA
jgi:hypothetical protein